MGWLIAFAVMGFMLAPIMWILPSRRQSQQVLVRAAAREAGLTVKVAVMPKTRRSRIRREEEVFGVCYLRSIHNKVSLSAWKYWLVDIPEGDDDSIAPSAELINIIESCRDKFPRDSTMLEFTAIGLQLFWRERDATVETVDAVAEGLNQIITQGELDRGK
ncbi:MAG: hypothetical protein ACI9BO_000014 [Zhongshania sp.]|jgi:hypothetical protein